MKEESPSSLVFPKVSGVPGSTLVPNTFFEKFIPNIEFIEDVLTLLWCAYLMQDTAAAKKRNFFSAEEIWLTDGVEHSYTKIGIDKEKFFRSLERCAEQGFLSKVKIDQKNHTETVFLLSNPENLGESEDLGKVELGLNISFDTDDVESSLVTNLFELYEENFGVVSPIVAENLIEISRKYDFELIKLAFQEAARHGVGSWRYIERILENQEKEGYANETDRRDSFEARKNNYTGGKFGHFARYR